MHFLLNPGALLELIVILLLVALTAYLITIRDKEPATRWLILFLACMAINLSIGGLVDSVVYGWAYRQEYYLQLLIYWVFFVATLAAIQFDYVFLENPFAREARFVFRLSCVFLIVYPLIGLALPALVQKIYNLLPTGLAIWGMGIWLRKWRRTRKEKGPAPTNRYAKAYRSYVLLTILPIFFGVSLQVWVSAPNLDWLIIPGYIAWLGFFLGLVGVYVNYSSIPSSFRAKLTGQLLMSVLAVFCAVVVILFPEGKVADGKIIPAGEAIRFEPQADGGYQVNLLESGYDDQLGVDLELADKDVAAIPLGFSFSFAGASYDSVYVLSDGMLVFERPVLEPITTFYEEIEAEKILASFYDGRPKIAPLYVNLDPSAGGGVYAQHQAGQVTISWHDVPRWFLPETKTRMQVVLHAQGAIEMKYDQVEVPMPGGLLLSTEICCYGARGILHSRASTEKSIAQWGSILPMNLRPGTDLVEDFDFAFRQQLHAETIGLGWLIFFSWLVVVLVFPFIFRAGLTQPLERLLAGVERVQRGDLDGEVEVGVQDEIGYLTQNFNLMTTSLRRYSQEMESLVSERTNELQKSLEELKKTQGQLIQREKLASLGQLSSGIAHEIKNPLNFVKNFAALNEELIDELSEDPNAKVSEVSELIETLRLNEAKIQEHGQRADRIVMSMMQHANKGKRRREMVAVNVLVEEYLNFALHSWHGRGTIYRMHTHEDVEKAAGAWTPLVERKFDASVGAVELVPQEIGQVLVNLFNNAFDAMMERKTRRGGRFDGVLTVATLQKKGFVEIHVTDNGPGIPDHLHDTIFEPFFTTKSTGSGTGLGLSLSFDIVTQGHGGSLEVESEPGEGATFIVKLPARL